MILTTISAIDLALLAVDHGAHADALIRAAALVPETVIDEVIVVLARQVTAVVHLLLLLVAATIRMVEDVAQAHEFTKTEVHLSKTWHTHERTHSRIAVCMSATCPTMSSGII